MGLFSAAWPWLVLAAAEGIGVRMVYVRYIRKGKVKGDGDGTGQA